MYSFGTKSRMLLSEVDSSLRKVLLEAIKIVDFSITDGYRSRDRQQILVEQGLSKTLNSKHNIYPSKAIDIAPFPYGTKEAERIKQLYYITGVIMGIAHQMKIKIRIGHDWDMNGDVRDGKFVDAWHIELV